MTPRRALEREDLELVVEGDSAVLSQSGAEVDLDVGALRWLIVAAGPAALVTLERT